MKVDTDSASEPANDRVGSEEVVQGGMSRIAALGDWLLSSPRMRDLLGFYTSLVFHSLLMVILALVLLDPVTPQEARTLLVGPHDLVDQERDFPELLVETPTELTTDVPLPAAAAEELPSILDPVDVPAPIANLQAGGLTSRPSLRVEPIPLNDLMLVSEAPVGGGFEGRTPQERARLVAERGGNAASEQAVELGLDWLSAHQWQDGSWHLDHAKGPCEGRCANPGTEIETRIGATGLALLPFLGAGYTHLQGKHRDAVRNGLNFLKKQIRVSNFGGDLSWDSTVGMYAHGISTLAFCEAYGMTGDPELRPFAQQAIDFICLASGPRGGWRYHRGEPGDTTVTGWQVMALKSARLSMLFVPKETTENAKLFLNTVQDGTGAFYGYMTPGKQPGPTAVGLLARMFLGWSRQDARLQRGVNYLAYLGPSSSDMYFNYYATQVLHHYEGNHWDKWNRVLRDFLVESQNRVGHERGSWFFADRHGSLGGRHYTTAICTMTLEVYYRHMPLYGERAIEDSL